jgi:hypothetical protein
MRPMCPATQSVLGYFSPGIKRPASEADHSESVVARLPES